MGWPTGIAVYFVVWWLSLFMVLPWGVVSSGHQEIGAMPGAPDNPHIKKKIHRHLYARGGVLAYNLRAGAFRFAELP